MHAVLRWTLGVATATLLASPISALPFSNLYVFGDSIVDTGNTQALVVGAGGSDPAPASAGYFDGRFTNGPNPADVVNQAIEATNISGSLLGGDNYAYGGARARAGADIIPDLAAQVGSYLGDAGGVADPNALYMINVGGNDIRDILLDGLDPNTVITAAVTEIVTQISALQFAGAQNVLFVGVGNVGGVPEIQPFGPTAIAAGRSISEAMNAAILGAVAPLGVTFFDTIAFGDLLFSDLVSQGIDVTHSCLASGAPAPGGPPNCEDFAFFDTVHPTSPVLVALGDGLVAAVPEPGTGLLVALGVVGMALHRRRCA